MHTKEFKSRLEELGGIDYSTRSHLTKKEDGFSVTEYRLLNMDEWVEFKDLSETQRKAMISLNNERSNESQRLKDKDTRFNMLYNIGKVKPTKLKSNGYYIAWMKENDISSVYVDMSFESVCIIDRCISSGYTSYGITEIDTWFCKQIQKFHYNESEFDLDAIKNMILCCPNLHEIIKWNLMKNLLSH